jgi:putative transposase
MVLVHSASIQDGCGGYQALQKLFDKIKHSLHNSWYRLKLIWADGAYVSIVEEVRKHFGWKLDIVRRSDKAKGFEILPHRWIVKRTFG